MPRSPEFGDVYHPRQGALAQARQVFLAGNELPARWRGREQFVVLETGFGLGNNFLATWQAWRDDPERSTRLHFLSIEARPLQRADLASEPRGEGLAPLAAQLAAAWPPLTCNLHRLSFDAGRVQLLLALGDVGDWLPQLVARVDAFFLDGFAPARNPGMWEPRLFKAMARIAAPDATAATWSVARPVRDGLAAAGFEVAGRIRAAAASARSPSPASRPDSRRGRARASGWRSRPRPRRRAHACRSPSSAAGSPAVPSPTPWHERGWASTLFERRSALAQEGSGNAAGVFHGVVHGHDGHHARFHRAAAYEAQRAVAEAIAGHGVRGSTSGLLRLASRGSEAARTAGPARPARLAGGLRARPVGKRSRGDRRHRRRRPGLALRRRRLGRAARSGSRLCRARRSSAWPSAASAKSPRSGAPPAAGSSSTRRAACSRRPTSSSWPTPAPPSTCSAATLALHPSRGQTSGIDSARWPTAAALRLPLAGSGYLLPSLDGTTWFGASSHEGDADPALRGDDHRANVERLAGLVAEPPTLAALGELRGRVGWRWASPDRLPLIGPVPLAAIGAELGVEIDAAASPRPEQPRFAPRAPGLFVFAGLGSRGIAGSALGAQVLAASITGAPLPLEADLLDAVDPARFASRAFRRAGLLPGAAG